MRENLKNARKRAGMTQQEVADKLEIGLRHYQKIEAGETKGSFRVWDVLEDILGIHQRKLREISKNHHVPEENR
ncbi:MAG: helix-turn-helix transcriptional regulator [Lachnospiraceae bacterium]|nr:helix-turn-helix transcriptional regulator [Lachnospiraceae bacterium]